MIQQQTIVKVIDNSGAKTAMCVKVLGGFKRKYAYVGDLVVVTIKSLRNRSKKLSKVKKGDVFKAVVLKTCGVVIKKGGNILLMKTNSVCLLNKQAKPVGKRIIGVLPSILRKKKYSKLISIASGVI